MAEEGIKSLKYPGGNLKGLYEPIEYALDAGGKRLRPVICLMACDGFCRNPKTAINQAVGLEMYHNFTLLHDDVMDNSPMRRGRMTVHKRWDENTAILSGDTMLTLASQLVCQAPADILAPVINEFNAMAIKVDEGQQLDMDFETRDDVTVEEYMQMIACKTGALIACAAKIGAVMGGASEGDSELMCEYGNSLGLAFQIADDYLDVYGDEKTFGKPIGGDIRNGKKTLLYLTGLKTSRGEELRAAMQNPDLEARVKGVTELYTELGIPELCRSEIERYTLKAIAALDATALADEPKTIFSQLARKLVDRAL